MVLVLCAAAVAGVFLRSGAAPTDPPSSAAAPAEKSVDAPPVAAPASAAAAAMAQPAPVTADDVARWSIEASSGDAAKRAAAIMALSHAPVEKALPILRRVLMSGEPAVDRPLALQSLRDLALDHGDPDSVIRNAIREAIYHGDDQTLSADAQEALDVIEESQLK